MSSVLPKSIDYRELPNSLSNDITSNTQILNPVSSKSTYLANDITNFDFNSGNRGFTVPKSIYIRFKVSCVTGVTAGAAIYGVPVYVMYCYANVTKNRKACTCTSSSQTFEQKI
jgi:hypothetical protein